MKRFLEIAKKNSEHSDHHTYKVGCVIAKGNRVIGKGFNVLKTHPRSPHQFKSVHAEFMAVISAGFAVKGATAYVFRQHKNGNLAIARPCKDCWKFLAECGIKKVVYSFEGSTKTEDV